MGPWVPPEVFAAGAWAQAGEQKIRIADFGGKLGPLKRILLGHYLCLPKCPNAFCFDLPFRKKYAGRPCNHFFNNDFLVAPKAKPQI